jgi:hypothetical protein
MILSTANLNIIDVRCQLSTVFSTSLLLEFRWNHDNGRQLFWDWQYQTRTSFLYLYIYIYIYVCVCVCVCVYTHTYIYLYSQIIYIYMCVCVCVYVCVCVCIHIHTSTSTRRSYIYIYIYIHTYIHLPKNTMICLVGVYMYKNVAVVSGWCNKISVSVSMSVNCHIWQHSQTPVSECVCIHKWEMYVLRGPLSG